MDPVFPPNVLCRTPYRRPMSLRCLMGFTSVFFCQAQDAAEELLVNQCTARKKGFFTTCWVCNSYVQLTYTQHRYTAPLDFSKPKQIPSRFTRPQFSRGLSGGRHLHVAHRAQSPTARLNQRTTQTHTPINRMFQNEIRRDPWTLVRRD